MITRRSILNLIPLSLLSRFSSDVTAEGNGEIRCSLIDLPLDIRPLYTTSSFDYRRGDNWKDEDAQPGDDIRCGICVSTRWCPMPGDYRAVVEIRFPNRHRSLIETRTIRVGKEIKQYEISSRITYITYINLRLPPTCNCIVIRELKSA